MSPTPFTRAIIFAGVLSAILVGCSGESPESGDSPDQTQQSSTTTIDAASVDVTQTVDEVLAANDTVHLVDDVDVSAGVDVDLSSPGKTDGVSVDGSTVTITAAGTYRLSGTLSGSLQIAAPDAHVTLILDGVTITSTSGPGIAATDVDELTVFLAEGSVNTVSDAAEYPQDIEANAALFSAGDLSITGVGTLNVQGAYEDAIASKDGLIIDSGTISVTAADDGIRGKDYVVVTSGEVSVTAGGDGLTANNDTDDTRGFVVVNGGTITVAARGDGISAETDLLVTGGQLTVESGTGSATAPTDDISTKGLKSGVMTIIAAGELTVDAQDDALHSNGAIVLTGGEILLASGDDAVHADGHLRASEGTLTITSSVEGIEGYHIALEGTTIDLVASDDGLNATGGNDMTTDGQAPPQSDDTEGCPVSARTTEHHLTVVTCPSRRTRTTPLMRITPPMRTMPSSARKVSAHKEVEWVWKQQRTPPWPSALAVSPSQPGAMASTPTDHSP